MSRPETFVALPAKSLPFSGSIGRASRSVPFVAGNCDHGIDGRGEGFADETRIKRVDGGLFFSRVDGEEKRRVDTDLVIDLGCRDHEIPFER